MAEPQAAAGEVVVLDDNRNLAEVFKQADSTIQRIRWEETVRASAMFVNRWFALGGPTGRRVLDGGGPTGLLLHAGLLHAAFACWACMLSLLVQMCCPYLHACQG